MILVRSILLFALAALAEIGGAWLVWQGVRLHRGFWFVAAGVLALGLYGLVATLQPDPQLGRVLAAYGGVFVAASLAWGVPVDGFRPDRYDLAGAALCLVGVVIIKYAPRPATWAPVAPRRDGGRRPASRHLGARVSCIRRRGDRRSC